MWTLFSIVILLTLVVASGQAVAQGKGGSTDPMLALKGEVEELKAAVKELKQLLEAQRQLLQGLKEARATQGQNGLEKELERELSEEMPPAHPPAAGAAPVGVVGLAGFNPEIGVVGDVVGRLSDSTGRTDDQNRFTFREAEVIFGTYVDPFSRADFAFVFSDGEDPEIEEAFYSHYRLPFALRGRAGKFRSKIGRINLSDLNALPFVDEPLVIRDFFGDEGFAATGIRLQRFIPNPWNTFLEGTLELMDGGNERSFAGIRRRPVTIAHLRSFYDLTRYSSLDAGVTAMTGTSRVLTGERAGTLSRSVIEGLDLTFRRKVTRFNDLIFQNEFFFQQRGRDKDALGFYNYLGYQFHPRWSAGARYDYLRPLGGGRRNWGGTVLLTFHQSEFARFRLQYQHNEFGRGGTEDSLSLQMRFQIGVDRHALQ